MFSEDYFGNDEFDCLEDWEVDYALLDKKDYRRLLKYRKQRAERDADDLYAQYYLGEAYILNKDYETAIDFLAKQHIQNPDIDDFQHLILDALFALGKNENDFNWIKRPKVLRMSKEILDSCYMYLKPKRKPRSVADIYITFLSKGYIKFSHKDLLLSLKQDGRFIIVDDVDYHFAEVKVIRKKK